MLAIWLPASPGWAWGQQGHRIVGIVAEAYVTPDARAQLESLLGGASLAEISNWADEVRPDRPETVRWHYVDIPRERERYDADRDCAPSVQGDCVVAAIARFTARLRTDGPPSEEKAEAVKFLTHLVADLHQPLHCLADDRGGTDLTVTFLGDALNPYTLRPWTLHAVWDAGLIGRAAVTDAHLAAELIEWLNHQSIPALVAGGPATWAGESKRLALAHAYRLRADRAIDAEYVEENWTIVKEQLARAGLRLADILNQAVGSR